MSKPNESAKGTSSSAGQASEQAPKDASGGVRRRSREMALQLLFQSSFSPANADGTIRATRDLIKRFASDFMVENDVAEYGGVLFSGVAEHQKEIDGVIQAHSTHWKIARMGLVDLSVMRVAVYEMKLAEPRLQPNIVINEAVEIAKKFGSTDSGAFVNGILDHVARGL